jgi:hypothetical protein
MGPSIKPNIKTYQILKVELLKKNLEMKTPKKLITDFF